MASLKEIYQQHRIKTPMKLLEREIQLYEILSQELAQVKDENNNLLLALEGKEYQVQISNTVAEVVKADKEQMEEKVKSINMLKLSIIGSVGAVTLASMFLLIRLLINPSVSSPAFAASSSNSTTTNIGLVSSALGVGFMLGKKLK